MKLFEKTLKKSRTYTGVLISVDVSDIEIATTKVLAKREVVNHPGGVMIACMDNHKRFTLVKQYRFASQSESLEFVAGKLEASDSDTLESAKRELAEEVGLTANNWVYLGYSYPSPAYLTEKIHFYLATDLTAADVKWDYDEQLVIEQYDLVEIIDKINNNEIYNLATIALAYRVQDYLLRKETK